MNSFDETDKRLKIAKNITSSLKGVAKGIFLGGSMGFGQNYSVTENSDVDLVIVTTRGNVKKLSNTNFSLGKVDGGVISSFKQGKIDMFWATKHIEGVEVNSFVYEDNQYAGFCLLNNGLRLFIGAKPSETQTSYGFDGKPITFSRKVIPFKSGFVYEKPALVKGRYWGGPPRQDFFYSGQVLYQEGNFLSQLEKRIWKATLEQLVKEYGPNPDLSRFNVLNTHFTYQTARERLPPKIIKLIQDRTISELKQVTLSQ